MTTTAARRLHQHGMAAAEQKSTKVPQLNRPRGGRPAVVELLFNTYQNTLIVNSVEEESNRQRLAGMEHYRHMMNINGYDAKPSLDRVVGGDSGASQDDMSTSDIFDNDVEPDTLTGSSTRGTQPALPASPSSYSQPIYSGTTHSPVVFFSILRIAQQNLPSLDLTSALNHLPNIHPGDSLPQLRLSAPGNLAPVPFIDNNAPPQRSNDADISIAFLPTFYSDARHALGYFEVLPNTHNSKKVGVCLFTPCTEDDLRRYGLVEYLTGREDEGVEGMSKVGASEGMWLDRDVVEEYEEWSLVWKVVSGVWKGRFDKTLGEFEG